MKTMTLRLPDELASEIQSESRRRKISKSDVVRERLRSARQSARTGSERVDFIADLIGSVDGLPPDLSSQKKLHLKATGYGKKRSH